VLEPQPSIELLGIVLREPITALTDVFIAIACLIAYFKLRRLPQNNSLQKLFKYHFLLMGIATFLGGVIGHALMNYLPHYMRLPGWIAGMISIALLERAVISYACKFLPANTGRFFLRLNIVELIFFATLILITMNFKFVLFHTVVGILIIVTGFTSLIYFKEKSAGSKYILYAIGVSVVGVIFFVLKLGLHKWFNHADIGHVFMIIATVFYFLGAKSFITGKSDFTTFQ